MLRESRRPVVLVDTDMSVGLDPEPLLAKLWCDFGVDFAGGDEAKWNINTGFLFFAPTPVAESIATCVVDWIDLVRSDVDGAFKKYVLDTVPEDARIEGKSDVRRADATDQGQRDLDDLPGTNDVPEPGFHRRSPDHRSAAASPWSRQAYRTGARR